MGFVMRKVLLALVAIAALLPRAYADDAGKKKFQCWTDDHGHRACGDSVPPQYSNQERDVLNTSGIVVEKKERPKTPEEQAAVEAEKQRAENEVRKRRQQAEYDRYLLQTFPTTHDLEETRDLRLGVLDTRIQLVEKAIVNSRAAADKLRETLEGFKKAGKPVSAKQEKQLRDYQRMPLENQKALEQLRFQRSDLEAQFTRDILRLEELRQASAAPH